MEIFHTPFLIVFNLHEIYIWKENKAPQILFVAADVFFFDFFFAIYFSTAVMALSISYCVTLKAIFHAHFSFICAINYAEKGRFYSQCEIILVHILYTHSSIGAHIQEKNM
jgi:hypothetical protein